MHRYTCYWSFLNWNGHLLPYFCPYYPLVGEDKNHSSCCKHRDSILALERATIRALAHLHLNHSLQRSKSMFFNNPQVFWLFVWFICLFVCLHVSSLTTILRNSSEWNQEFRRTIKTLIVTNCAHKRVDFFGT